MERDCAHRGRSLKQRLRIPAQTRLAQTQFTNAALDCIVERRVDLTSRVWLWGRCSSELRTPKLKGVRKRVLACDQLSPPLNRLAMSLTDIFIGSLGSPRALSQSMTTFLASSIGTERVEGGPFDALLALSASP